MSSPTPSTVPTTQTVPPSGAPGPKPPSASLYVGDLHPDVNEGMLADVFASVGPLSSIRVCRDTLTRRSLGYAYVNFHSAVDAERALDALNNTMLAGRPCRIMWSQRDPSIRKTGVGNIFIKNLAPNIGHKELYDTFSAFGNILSCKVAMDEHGKSKGYGFVHFENQQCADQACQMVNDNIMMEKKVFVGPFIPRRQRTQQLESSWTNVFIKDIDLEISNEELARVFSEFGKVTSAVIMRKPDGTSLGFGFVNFLEHESATAAVDKMHGEKLGSKVLYCCRAQKKNERERLLRKEWEQQKISKYQGINLYIKNIEDEIDEERLRKEFAQFGVIKSCKIMADPALGTSRGFGFVCFSNQDEAQLAITKMHGCVLPGCQKPLYVAMHEPKELRRQKLTLNAYKNIRATGVPQGAAPMAAYSGPGGQTVYYSQGASAPYLYPQQMMTSMPRGWQPQYPPTAVPHSGYPNGGTRGSPQGQQGGQPVPAGRAGRGSNTSRGGSGGATGGRGRNQGRNQQPEQQMGMAPPQFEAVSLAQVKSLQFEQQKMFIGERLYALIAVTQPVLAGKITGMFLDAGWSIDELFALLSDGPKLNEKIEDALSVLEQAQQIPDGIIPEQGGE